MKRALRVLAAILVLAGAVFWWAAGANRGWTITDKPKVIVDEVTGIEGRTYEKAFIPGVDFLGGIAAAAAALVGVSFLFRKKNVGTSN